MAKDFLLQAIDKNPDVAESYFYLGKCYFFCDEKQNAIAPLKKFINLSPCDELNASHVFDLMGLCFEAENKIAVAEKYYKSAVKINPDCASAWHNMGLLHIKSALTYLETDLENSAKLFNNALSFIKKALELCNENSLFLQSVASWHEQYIEVLGRAVENEDAVQKNFGYAIQYYRKALSACHEQDLALRAIILSNLTECLAQYGHNLYKNKDYKNAQEIYLEALRLDPEHLVVINQIGMSLFKQDCFPEARKYFSSILEKTEEKQEIADAWLNIACTYRLEKKWNKADEALGQAKKFAPEDSSITEEEMKLNDSKLAALFISIPQTLLGSANLDPKSTESKTTQESNLQFEFN